MGQAYSVLSAVCERTELPVPHSPVTQSFGLGIFEELSAASLDVIERFFVGHGAPVLHEVSPLAGVAALGLLCARNYRPIEISNVLYQPVEKPAADHSGNITVRVIGPEEAQLWADIGARGWASEHPELLDFLRQLGPISAARQHSVCFLGEVDGKPVAAAGSDSQRNAERKGFRIAYTRTKWRLTADR